MARCQPRIPTRRRIPTLRRTPTRRAGRPLRPLLVVAAATAGLVLTACGGGETAGPTPSGQPTTPAPESPSPTAGDPTASDPTPSTPPSSPADSCAALVAGLSRDEQIGQLFMPGVGVPAWNDSVATTFANAKVGSVLLLENTEIGRSGVKGLSDEITAAVDQPDGVELMIAADQEGGLVQRLKGEGFSEMPAATEQAGLSDAELRSGATTWGEELAAAGVDINLAPVADVVPEEVGAANEPIGALDRGYGSDVDVVSSKVDAFAAGMDEAGIATAVKHFPGLGRVRGNTDLETRVVDDSTTRDDADLAGFGSAVEHGADMVMVGSAVYSEIDAEHPAMFSSTVVEEMIRTDLGFDGVVISDDVGAAKAVSHLSPGERAVDFLAAGGDVVINADPSILPAMVEAVAEKAAADDDFAAELEVKATRVVTMKEARGHADCG